MFGYRPMANNAINYVINYLIRPYWSPIGAPLKIIYREKGSRKRVPGKCQGAPTYSGGFPVNARELLEKVPGKGFLERDLFLSLNK